MAATAADHVGLPAGKHMAGGAGCCGQDLGGGGGAAATPGKAGIPLTEHDWQPV